MGHPDDHSPPAGRDRLLHWWHLGALLVLVAGVEGGRSMLGGASIIQALASLPHSLYNWCPILAGVAISIRRADTDSSRDALRVGLFVTLLMLLLDLVGGAGPPPEEFFAVVTPEGLSSRGTADAGSSWILEGTELVRGGLTGVEERLPLGQAYPAGHPRLRAANALQDASLILLVFGTLGLVLGAGRWIRGHVIFQRKEDERGAHLVVAWLLSPVAVGVALPASERLTFAALFDGGPLWAILLPPLGVLALGVIAWVGATRNPPDDDPAAADEP